MKFLRRFLSVDRLLSKKYHSDLLPSNKEAYSTAFQMAWPSSLEMVLIGLIGSADLIMVSHLGSEAIAATGITTQPKYILLAFVLALNTGVTIIISRRIGQNKVKEANAILINALTLSFIVSILMTVIGLVFAKQILMLAGATSDYIDIATNYFKIIVIGNFFVALANTLTSAQRGAGNTKISLITNLTANIVNIIFNYLLIYGVGIFPKMGVTGAALATLIGNVISFLIAFVSILNKNNKVHIDFKEKASIQIQKWVDLVRVSSSAFIEQIFTRVGYFVFAIVIAKLGTQEFATHQVVMNILNISFSVGEGLSIATSTLAGLNLGKKRFDLAMLYSRVLQRIGVIVSIILSVVLVVFRIEILSLFSQGNSSVLTLGEPLMFIVAVTVVFQILGVITLGTLRAGGDLKFTAFLLIISIGIIRPITSYVFAISLSGGLIAAWISVLLDQSIRTIVSQKRYQSEVWLDIVI